MQDWRYGNYLMLRWESSCAKSDNGREEGGLRGLSHEDVGILSLMLTLLFPLSCPQMSKPAPKKAVAPPPPGFTLDINDPQVQNAAIRIQASYRGHSCFTLSKCFYPLISLHALALALFAVVTRRQETEGFQVEFPVPTWLIAMLAGDSGCCSLKKGTYPRSAAV
ncbi:hypothetical protein JD844_022275 [Phrynosoma platyrhinos]|uniref:Uncharacterized protein n=1 Tax=Phrynosoma platyrhinos TaxID=52577 RepID=A0ABQ7SVU7_PHRPL|nr:hypothetical protein JD844_022275 [Phrynosoma platyrhinos]